MHAVKQSTGHVRTCNSTQPQTNLLATLAHARPLTSMHLLLHRHTPDVLLPQPQQQRHVWQRLDNRQHQQHPRHRMLKQTVLCERRSHCQLVDTTQGVQVQQLLVLVGNIPAHRHSGSNSAVFRWQTTAAHQCSRVAVNLHSSRLHSFPSLTSSPSPARGTA